MLILITLLLILSLAGNIILIWYTRKLIQNLYYGVNNIDEMQKLLNEYADLLAPLANLDNFYGEPALSAAIANTKLVIDACRVYKKTIIENYNEENQENQENTEDQETNQETRQNSPNQASNQTGGQEARRKAEATIGPISANNS